MGLLSKLKSVLGLGSGDDDRGDRRTGDVGVTVERERDEADAANEAAVKGVDEESGASTTEGTDQVDHGEESDEEPEDEGEAAAEDETEPEPADEADETVEGQADETVEGQADEDEADEDETGESEAGESEADESEATDEAEAEDDAGGDLQDIKGIGPAYADRLREVGIESIAELADADFEAVAEEADLAPGRVEGWVDRANARQ